MAGGVRYGSNRSLCYALIWDNDCGLNSYSIPQFFFRKFRKNNNDNDTADFSMAVLNLKLKMVHLIR